MCICWIHIFFEYDGIVFIPSFWKNVSLFEKGLYLVLLKHLKLQNILRVTFAFRRYFLKLTNVSFSMHDQCTWYLNQVPTLHDWSADMLFRQNKNWKCFTRTYGRFGSVTICMHFLKITSNLMNQHTIDISI